MKCLYCDQEPHRDLDVCIARSEARLCLHLRAERMRAFANHKSAAQILDLLDARERVSIG
jgi:hypothetical protein